MMNKAGLVVSVAFVSTGVISDAAVAQESSDDWQFAASVYGWFPDIGGNTVAADPGDDSIDVDVSTILDHLKMTAQGSFEFHKGRWGGFTDLVYLDVGESKSGSRDITIGGVTLPAGDYDQRRIRLEVHVLDDCWQVPGSDR